MTKELRERTRLGFKPRYTPYYIDHGHLGRKFVFWSVFILLLPFGLMTVAANVIGRFGEWLDSFAGAPVYRLRAWSHPCIYGGRQKLPAPELSDEWEAKS